MPLCGQVTFTADDLNDPVTITYTIEDSDIAILEAYCKYVDELSTATLVKHGIPTSFEFKYKTGEGCQFSATLPDWDHVAVLLHRLRPLILHKEHASFDTVSGIVGRILSSPYAKRTLKEIRKTYSGKRFQSQILIASDGSLLNSEDALMNYLNAFEYHRDQDKALEFGRLHQLLPSEASKSLLLILLSEKIKACYSMADLIKLILCKAVIQGHHTE